MSNGIELDPQTNERTIITWKETGWRIKRIQTGIGEGKEGADAETWVRKEEEHSIEWDVKRKNIAQEADQ